MACMGFLGAPLLSLCAPALRGVRGSVGSGFNGNRRRGGVGLVGIVRTALME